MPRIHTAHIAAPGQDPGEIPEQSLEPLAPDLVVATVSARSPRLSGADWVRIDGGQSPITAAAIRRNHAPVPALFDIPGAQTRRYRNLFTTTESLVFYP